MSLGTPHYMSPEQAMGEREITARSDVYALGCVTYEMLAGEPPFTGPTAQAIIARVMTEEPRSLTVQRKTIPPNVEAAVNGALAKLPADRFATAAEFATALAGGGSTSRQTAITRHAPSTPAASRRTRIAVAVGAVVLAVVAAWGWLRPTGSSAMVSRWSGLPPKDIGANGFAISPDGSRIVFGAGDKSQLMVRDADDIVAKPVPEAPNAYFPFFSPQGDKVAFVTAAPGALKIVSLSGGAASTIVPDSAYDYGGDWSDDGWVYYLGGSGGRVALMRVRSEGGAPQLIASPDTAKNELFFYFPKALPGGKQALITIIRRSGEADIAVVELKTGVRTVLTRGVEAAYAASGHLVVMTSDGGISAAPFDPARGVLRGPFVPLKDRASATSFLSISFALSRSGTLAYSIYPVRHQVVRISRSGDVQPVDPAWTSSLASGVSISPDGKRLAFSLDSNSTESLWVRSLENGTLTLLAAGGTDNARPVWSLDGRSVTFVSDRTGRDELHQVPADGSSPPILRLSTPRGIDEGEYSRDGAWLIYRVGVGGGRDIFGIHIGQDTVPVPLVVGPAEEDAPALSPDGHWLAYNSNESGTAEVYVRPFPNTNSAKYPVSNRGGTEPRWSHSGRELFYRDGAGNLVAVRIAAGPDFQVAGKQVLFPAAEYLTDGNDHSYDISADDQSFYFIRPTDKTPPQLIVVLNWLQEVKAKVGH